MNSTRPKISAVRIHHSRHRIRPDRGQGLCGQNRQDNTSATLPPTPPVAYLHSNSQLQVVSPANGNI